MLDYVDGTMVPPPRFEPETSSTLNTKYLSWKAVEQSLLCLLLSSLTEEAILIVVGLSTTRDVCLALITMKVRELRLKDDLQLRKHDTKHVAEYAQTFKIICDQLHAIADPSRTLIQCTCFFVDSAPIFQLFLLLKWFSPLFSILQI